VGACLDRNGLRPARYWRTKDDIVYVASEVYSQYTQYLLLHLALCTFKKYICHYVLTGSIVWYSHTCYTNVTKINLFLTRC
jgi:Glutamine amidotransferases class-II